MPSFTGFVWLLLLLGPLLLLQRQLHRQIQISLLLLTRRTEIASALFALLFFPGVLLHETSHFIVARLLGVRTGRFSLLPKVVPSKTGKAGETARLQLGFVETGQTDIIRDSLIGAAPLFFGGAFVAYVGLYHLGITPLWMGSGAEWGGKLLENLIKLFRQPDFGIWFYLAFTVSSTMFPSASDRRAWLPFTMILVLLLALSLLAGAGPWLLANLAPFLNRAFLGMATVLGISVALHFVLLIPFWLFALLLSRLTGLQVVG